MVIGSFGCGRVSESLTDTNSYGQTQSVDLKSLDASIASITDEASASNAINDLETYANKKTNSGIHISSAGGTFKTFTITDSLKEKLVKAELALHKKHPTIGLKTASDSDSYPEMTEEEYIKSKEQQARSGLSAQDVADALNNAISQQSSGLTSSSIKSTALKIANAVKPFTANDVDLIKDKAMQLLPSSGDPGSDRISPIQALVIGYMAASNDDGAKADGAVSFFAGQEQVDGFVTNITSKLGQ